MRPMHLVLLIAGTLVLTACPPKPDDTAPEGDTDADTDADTDTDADADADTDADADADADTDADADADTDADADADSDTDTDTDLDEEICDDGHDNDGDGLVDCEDEDCFDACIEVCDDRIDNDRDGLVDCEDDECVGDPACSDLYTVTLTITPEDFGLATGSMVTRYWGYGAVGLFTGRADIYGVSADGSDTFTCRGDIEASFATGPYGAPYYGGFTYFAGATTGAGDYVFLLEPDSIAGSLSWVRTCPVVALPPAYLGMSHGSTDIMRQDVMGAWYAQYSVASTRDMYYRYEPRKGVATTMWYGPVQAAPIVWTGSYAP